MAIERRHGLALIEDPAPNRLDAVERPWELQGGPGFTTIRSCIEAPGEWMSHRLPQDWIPLAPLLGRLGSAGRPATADPQGAGAQAPWLTALAHWVAGFVAKPHPELGRSGAVCPFVPAALEKNLLFVGAGLADLGTDEGVLSAALLDGLETFLATAPLRPEGDFVYKAVLYALPQLTADADGRMPRIRARVKPTLLARGVTCADFYPQNTGGSIRNGAFPLGRAPVPNLVLRHVATHDELLLRSQPELREIYRRFMSGR